MRRRVLLIRNVYLVVVLVAAAVFFSFAYLFHTLYPPSSPSCIVHQIITLPTTTTTVANETTTQQQPPPPTSLEHIVFGIAGSAKLWNHRKNYVKLWWSRHKDENIRGFVWLDKLSTNVLNENNDRDLPPVCISENTQRFPYAHRTGNRAAIRISRILTETVRMGLKDVRWVVMGDDDTWFVPENLVRVLRKYDHEQYYYIGSVSESHIQNIAFSYDMAFGGGGFAISYPLAVLIAKVQDRCIERYPELYGSDDRMQACMAEVGVPLTKEPGFHQLSVSEHVSSGAYPKCEWKMNSPGEVKKVLVYKSPNPRMWEKSPRRNCCKVMPSTDKAIVLIAVGTCSEDEIFGTQKFENFPYGL
ncbi:hypothetical protein Scep_026263 [Stephania cephalantha]|uniref:Uncharacterized protein n=1 Tax=Stephania cephalantha TaxID=152367 RepID=A0AAP0ETP7_9MAGN